MQTFLPYPDFIASARVLDSKRLGKQRVEALQVLRGLIRPGYGWRLRKDPAHYGTLFTDVPDDLPYVWPASDRDPRLSAS